VKKYTQKQLISLVKLHVEPRYWSDAMVMAVELSFKLGQEFKHEQLYKIENILAKTEECQNASSFTRNRTVAKSSIKSYGG
jgi:hypothetical protein